MPSQANTLDHACTGSCCVAKSPRANHDCCLFRVRLYTTTKTRPSECAGLSACHRSDQTPSLTKRRPSTPSSNSRPPSHMSPPMIPATSLKKEPRRRPRGGRVKYYHEEKRPIPNSRHSLRAFPHRLKTRKHSRPNLSTLTSHTQRRSKMRPKKAFGAISSP